MPLLKLPTFIFLNGPPRSGKTTLANALEQSQPSVWTESFMEPVRQTILSTFFPNEVVSPGFNLREPEVKNKNLFEYAGLHLEADERDPSDLPSATVREFMFTYCDSVRDQFGEDIFGRLCFKRCKDQSNYYETFIIDDAGHRPETKFIVDQIGPSNCALIRIRRAGFEFRSDGRNYLSLDGVKTIDINNDGPPDRLLEVIESEFRT